MHALRTMTQNGGLAHQSYFTFKCAVSAAGYADRSIGVPL
jgi:hypothetical protein